MTVVAGIANQLLDWLVLWNSPHVLTTISLTLLAVLTLRMLVVACRGVPVLAAPRCGPCGHAVDSPTSQCCAECGAPLNDARVAYGWRRRSWWRALLAVLVMALGIAATVRYPGIPGRIANRLIVGGALAIGLQRPDVFDEAAQSLSARLQSGANEDEVTDAMLAVLGPAPAAALEQSQSSRELLADLGRRAIIRQDTDRIDALANASHPPPRFTVRRRHRPLQNVCIDIEGPIAVGGTGFITMLLPLQCTIDGVVTVASIMGPGFASRGAWGFYCDARWTISAPAALGVHEVRIAWQQVVVPAVVQRADGSSDTSNAVWTRDGAFEATIEVVDGSDPVLEAVESPSESPWVAGLDALRQLELRDIDDRMLVTFGIGTTMKPSITIAGQWFARQDGIERPLQDEVFRRRPIRWYFARVWAEGHAKLSLITPRIDPSRSFQLVYKPAPVCAELEATTACEHQWSGVTEITITPKMLKRDPLAADPTWIWTKP